MTESDKQKRTGRRKASSRAELHQRKEKAKKKSLFAYLTGGRVSFIATSIFTFFVAGLLALAYFMQDLPDVSKLTEVRKTPSIVLRTDEGVIIGSSGDIYGEYVPYKDIPRDMIKALVATEDRNFFTHFGIDPFGLVRAAGANVIAGRIVQGGSTITQQLAKNVFLTPERSFKRKIQEVILALSLEHKYTKQDIITIYLNRVYFGAGTYGIDAAAHRYFNKPAKKLMLPESALIIGLLKAPSRYAPTSNKELAVGRAKQVLINMQDAGLLEENEVKTASQMYNGLSFPKFSNSNSTRYYTDWILEQIPDYVGNVDRDLIVTTSFNPALQEQAEKAVQTVMEGKESTGKNVTEAALFSMSPDGAVLAVIGGKDYSTSQFNRAVQARRQPGSAFKLLVYLAAVEAGWQPYSRVNDAPVFVGNWAPTNYDNKYHGEMYLREAFEHSINTVAVRLSENVGRSKVVEMAHRLGITSKMQAVPSIALGVTETNLAELTTAYAHLASGGIMVVPYGILSIQDTMGNSIYQRKAPNKARVLSTSTVAQMNDMLMAVIESGTGKAAAIGRPAGGKTGTSQDFRDAWFIGFTPQLVTGVWVGNDNNKSMRKITGGNLPAHIWHDYMQTALKDQPVYALPRNASGNNGFFNNLFGSGTAPATRHDLPDAEGENSTVPEEKAQLNESFWNKLFSGDGEENASDPRKRTDKIRR